MVPLSIDIVCSDPLPLASHVILFVLFIIFRLPTVTDWLLFKVVVNFPFWLFSMVSFHKQCAWRCVYILPNLCSCAEIQWCSLNDITGTCAYLWWLHENSSVHSFLKHPMWLATSQGGVNISADHGKSIEERPYITHRCNVHVQDFGHYCKVGRK